MLRRLVSALVALGLVLPGVSVDSVGGGDDRPGPIAVVGQPATADQMAAVPSLPTVELAPPELSEPGDFADAPVSGSVLSKEPQLVGDVPVEVGGNFRVWETSMPGVSAVEVLAEPTYYRDHDSGSWLPIEPGVEVNPDRDDWLRTTGNSWEVEFGPFGSDAGGVELTVGDDSVSFHPRGAAAVLPEIVSDDGGTSVVYRGVWPGVDVVYWVTAGGVREEAVLSSAKTSSFAFEVTGGTIEAIEADREHGPNPGFRIVSNSGFAFGRMPAPVVGSHGRVMSDANAATVLDEDGRGYTTSVDGEWLQRLPPEAFPVRVDPEMYLSDVFSKSGSAKFTSGGTLLEECYYTSYDSRCPTNSVRVGNDGSNNWRSWYALDWTSMRAAHPDWSVLQGYLRYKDYGNGTPSSTLTTYTGVSWFPNTVAAYQGTGTLTTNTFLSNALSSQSTITSFMQSAYSSNAHTFGVSSSDPVRVYQPILQLFMYDSADPVSISYPFNDAVVTTATPKFTSTTAVGLTFPNYYFEVSTDSQPGKGLIASSGWKIEPEWRVLSGVLADGVSYYIRVYVADRDGGTMLLTSPSESIPFKIDLRLGSGGPSPTDSVGSVPGSSSTPSEVAPGPGLPTGSVSVNTVTGNLAFGVGAHSVATVGGPISVGLSYNQQAQSNRGLLGLYTRSGATMLRRVDSSPSGDWGYNGPGNGMYGGFSVVWTGYIQVPLAGSWSFGTLTGGKSRVTIDDGGTLRTVVSRWSNHTVDAAAVYGTSVSLTAGTLYPITVEYDNESSSNPAVMQMWLTEPGSGGAKFPAPADWLTTTSDVLPAGWTMQASNARAVWTRLVDYGNVVVATATDGSATPFVLSADSGYRIYQQANDGTSVLTMATYTNGGPTQWIISSLDGTIHTFDTGGKLISVSTGRDDRHPAAATYNYSGSPLRLSSIADPVSGQSVTLTYGGGSCATGTNAPTGMLCKVHYWDGIDANLFYGTSGSANKQLIKIIVGNATATIRSDLGYDSYGRLSQIVDPLTNEALATGQLSSSAGHTTDVVYWDNGVTGCNTGSNDSPMNGRVCSITQPAPLTTSTANRAGRTYTYHPAATDRYTDVNIVGLTGVPYASRITYDADSRVVGRSEVGGETSIATWNGIDQVTSVIDGQGLMSTTIYDANHRPVESWGPAPASGFKPDLTPTTPSAVAHTETRYDEGITGLRATYFKTPLLAGAPVLHATDGFSASGIYHDFGASPPAGVTPTTPNEWSALYVGQITFPADGWYSFYGDTRGVFRAVIDGTVVYADYPSDGSVANNWWASSGSSFYQSADASHMHTIRLEYSQFNDFATSAGFKLRWRLPGTSSYVAVPETTLKPNYGLPTSNTDRAGIETATSYSDGFGITPELGLPITTTVDPGSGGLQLTTTTNYEQPSSTTFLRRTSKSLPDGDGSVYSYYGGTTTLPASTCGVSTSVPQGGFVQQVIGQDPDGSGSQLARAVQFVYDSSGRIAGRRVGTTGAGGTLSAAGWECIFYDVARGRITSHTWPAHGSALAITLTYTYAISGKPLDNSVSDGSTTITSSVDLLGRVVKYTDATGNTTSTTYDQVGRPAGTAGPLGTVSYGYDSRSRPTTTTVDSSVLSTITYDTTTGNVDSGLVDHITYANGVTATLTYDTLGRADTLVYTNSSSQPISGSGIARDVAGRVADQLHYNASSGGLDDPKPSGANLEYDNAGRLTKWSGPASTIDYNYIASSGCSGNSATGKNTNRVSKATTDRYTSTTITDTYCYDRADRIIANGQATTFATYDDHGNTTRLDSDTYTWDAADRHRSIIDVATSNTVTYGRDALDRLIGRTDNATLTAVYGYSGPGGTPVITRASSGGTIVEKRYFLAGGVSYTKRPSGTNVWSYSDMQGNTIRSANDSGATTWSATTFDPDGNTISYVDNSTSAMDMDAAGTSGILTEHRSTITPTTQMGARPYLPSVGRFLTVDPVEGGCANDYAYVFGDPINTNDLSGRAVQSCSNFKIDDPHGTVLGRISDRGVFQLVWRPIFYHPDGHVLPNNQPYWGILAWSLDIDGEVAFDSVTTDLTFTDNLTDENSAPSLHEFKLIYHAIGSDPVYHIQAMPTHTIEFSCFG